MCAAFELSPATLDSPLLGSLVNLVATAAAGSPSLCARLWAEDPALLAPLRRRALPVLRVSARRARVLLVLVFSYVSCVGATFASIMDSLAVNVLSLPSSTTRLVTSLIQHVRQPPAQAAGRLLRAVPSRLLAVRGAAGRSAGGPGGSHGCLRLPQRQAKAGFLSRRRGPGDHIVGPPVR